MKKLAPIFTFLILLVSSCSVDPVEVSSARTQSQNVNQTAVEPTFMSGNINGVPYSNLKPQTYFDNTSFQTEVETYHPTPLITYNYLLLQGSDITYIDESLANSVLINLRIPQSQWAVGTYDLKGEDVVGINGVDSCASLIEFGTGMKTKSISGTLTITEFDIISRTVKGTFSFTYFRRNNGVAEGPYQLTNGVFKYKLDAPYFD